MVTGRPVLICKAVLLEAIDQNSRISRIGRCQAQAATPFHVLDTVVDDRKFWRHEQSAASLLLRR